MIDYLTNTPENQYHLKMANRLAKQIGINNDITLENDIAKQNTQTQAKYAKTASDFFDSIKNYTDPIEINKAMVDNMPDILKNHEYSANPDGSFNIDWRDLQGKSINHLKWDANYWQKKAIGYNQSNRGYNHAQKWFNHHQRELGIYKTNPRKHLKGISRQTEAVEHYNQIMHGYQNDKINSWLAKIQNAQWWANYHENKVDMLVYDRPKYQSRINTQIKLRNKWQAKISQYTQWKNNDLNNMRIYQNAIQQRQHKAVMAHNETLISNQVDSNDENNLISIYDASGNDPTVIGVAEMTPTDEISMNVPSKSIDDDMPQVDLSQVSEIQLSGNYMIYISNNTSRENQYQKLLSWTKHAIVAIKGRVHWGKAFITSLQRSTDTNSTKNGYSLSMTLIPARVAKIEMSKSKKAPATKRKGRRRRQAKKPQSKEHRIKANDTYWQLAQTYHTTPSKLEHANKGQPARDLQIGDKLTIP